MKCPECIKEGKRSIVTQEMCSSTAMYVPIRWDEDGKRMTEDHSNTTTTEYSCSNGHNWTETE